MISRTALTFFGQRNIEISCGFVLGAKGLPPFPTLWPWLSQVECS
jgi:hypothetical protein